MPKRSALRSRWAQFGRVLLRPCRQRSWRRPIIFAPVGGLVPLALKAMDKSGTVVCGGIHMSDIPSFSYDLLWEERSVCSVANLTRQDGKDFFKIAPRVPVKTTVEVFPLEQANEVLDRLRNGKIHGAVVLSPT